MSQRSQVSRVTLQCCEDSDCQFGQTEQGTRSPIELLWTAKNIKIYLIYLSRSLVNIYFAPFRPGAKWNGSRALLYPFECVGEMFDLRHPNICKGNLGINRQMYTILIQGRCGLQPRISQFTKYRERIKYTDRSYLLSLLSIDITTGGKGFLLSQSLKERKASCSGFCYQSLRQARLVKDQDHQEPLAVIFFTICKAWLGNDWQRGSQYPVLHNKESTKLDARTLLIIITCPEDCTSPLTTGRSFMSCPLGACCNEGEGTDGVFVGVVGGVFSRTTEGLLFDESQMMFLLSPQTPPVGLVQPQKPQEWGSLLKEQVGDRGWTSLFIGQGSTLWVRRRSRSCENVIVCMLFTD